MASPKRAHVRKKTRSDNRLYALQVFLVGGPITEEFAKHNKQVSRTIQIRGDQTLQDLHEAIFEAFDRDDEHMYEFQFGKGPDDPKGKQYVLPMALEDPFGTPHQPAGDLTRTTLASLNLKVNQSFGYWFDFGDDWYHQVDVIAISDELPKGKYPKVTERVGESPPQYPDLDEEEGDEDDWDEGEN